MARPKYINSLHADPVSMAVTRMADLGLKGLPFLAQGQETPCTGHVDLFDYVADPPEHRSEREYHDFRVAQAKALCAQCPVRTACAEYAVANKEQGVWGGLTDKERFRLTNKFANASLVVRPEKPKPPTRPYTYRIDVNSEHHQRVCADAEDLRNGFTSLHEICRRDHVSASGLIRRLQRHGFNRHGELIYPTAVTMCHRGHTLDSTAHRRRCNECHAENMRTYRAKIKDAS